MPTVRECARSLTGSFSTASTATEPKHVHVRREHMVCKFWLEPVVLNFDEGFPPAELNRIRKLIVEHRQKYFGGLG